MDNIKELIEKNKSEIIEICETLKFLDDKKNFLNKQIKDYEKEIMKGIRITDHSIVQYFQRVLGYDIEEIKQELKKDDLEGRYNTLGNNTYDQGKFRVVVLNNTIITTLEPKFHKK